MTVTTAPCAWDLDTTCCSTWDDTAPALQTLAAGMATEILWRLTGRRFGLCPITVRPCRKTCAQGLERFGSWSDSEWMPPFTPIYEGGAWLNLSCGQCVNDCSCSTLCEIALPGPVASVTSVKINGVVVPAAEYVVHDHRTLVRLGDECWPSCQDLGADPDDVNGTAFAVTYLQGVPVPIGGRLAAGLLACEIAKGCAGSSGCKLPNSYLLESVSREGVSVRYINPLDLIKEGLTGLPLVDLWVRSTNPNKMQERSSVWSVDRMPPRTVTS